MHWRQKSSNSKTSSAASQRLGAVGRWTLVLLVWWTEGLCVLLSWALSKLAHLTARVAMGLAFVAAILHGIRLWLNQ